MFLKFFSFTFVKTKQNYLLFLIRLNCADLWGNSQRLYFTKTTLQKMTRQDKWATAVEGNPKAPFSMLLPWLAASTATNGRDGHNSYPVVYTRWQWRDMIQNTNQIKITPAWNFVAMLEKVFVFFGENPVIDRSCIGFQSFLDRSRKIVTN